MAFVYNISLSRSASFVHVRFDDRRRSICMKLSVPPIPKPDGRPDATWDSIIASTTKLHNGRPYTESQAII
ncbi:hypothetical protein AFCA_003730 [Aspergillus flavus]|nr:hypothetical protein AFLA_000912 [Aspergillus flavus NRRL3357]UDD56164.1 hypothetical protein AFCA_003730 [Aspergillus flavus]